MTTSAPAIEKIAAGLYLVIQSGWVVELDKHGHGKWRVRCDNFSSPTEWHPTYRKAKIAAHGLLFAVIHTDGERL